MFGYVRVRQDTLEPEERVRYEAAYCGVCRAMGKEYGQFSRLFLNYDFALLAMLLAPGKQTCEAGCKRCLVHPVRGRPACQEGPWLDQAAGESVILTYWKLRDTVVDSGFFKGLPARFFSLLLLGGYKKARRLYGDFDTQVRFFLDKLSELEKAGCGSIDQTADCFAQLLQAAAPDQGRGSRDRALRLLLYHVGRWIYLIDAVEDLPKDRLSGSYNPLVFRFPEWTQEDKEYLQRTMEQSLELARSAFQLLEPNAWTLVVENILYSGLPGVQELVFAGKWQEYKSRKGEAANE